MPPTEVVCHRCGNRVKGSIEQKPDGRYITMGFYNLNDPLWLRFKQHDGETVICDNCMQADPRYQQEFQRGNYSYGG